MTYKLTKSTNSITGVTTEGDIIIRIADNGAIPIDEANTDYQEYKLWLAEGNTPEAAD
jgi:hypothetical protein